MASLNSKKGYYEDYLRKQSTDRALADPPVLLTDRSAYVNFLEVQLERVSAACMVLAHTTKDLTICKV